MATVSRQVHFAFQPLYRLHTGEVVAVEALTRPSSGTVRDLLDGAHRRGRLVQVDVTLAAHAARAGARHAADLPCISTSPHPRPRLHIWR